MNRGDLSKPLSVAGHRALIWVQAQQEAAAGGQRGERRFVPAADVAHVCNLTMYCLDTRYRPAEWASPRDFVFARGRVLMYARASLPQLAAALEAAGMAEASAKLRIWIAAGSGGEDAKSPTKTENVPSATAPARTPEGGWAAEWERKQS